MAQDIPITPSDPWQEITVPLDDSDGSSTPYIFELKWNLRDLSWYLNIYEANGAVVITGVRVVLGMYLGRRSRHDFFRKGVLVAIDTAAKKPGQGKEAGLDDFGTRVILRRYTAQEVVTGRAVRKVS
jgi:hypothetical protein